VSGRPLPPTGRCRSPRTTARCSARRSPQRSSPRASTRGRDRDRHRLHRVHDGPDPLRRHAAVRAGAVRRPPARVREAVEAPRRPGPRPTASTGWPRSGPRAGCPATAADLVGVGVRQGAGAVRGGPRALRRHGAGGSRRDWIVWQLCGATSQRVHRGLQGHPAAGRYPSPEFLEELAPGFAGFRPGQARTRRSGGCGCGRRPTDTRGGGPGPGLPEGIAVAVASWTPT
jgi:hypothetical protein